MLPGEDFGRGHQHGLVAVGHGQQHRVDGHDRLAAAHVALQQPVHRHAAGHVGGDLGDRLLLARPSARRETAGGCGRRSCAVASSGAPGAASAAAAAARPAPVAGRTAPGRRTAAGPSSRSLGRRGNGSPATPAASGQRSWASQILGRERPRRARRRSSSSAARTIRGSATAAGPRSADRRAGCRRRGGSSSSASSTTCGWAICHISPRASACRRAAPAGRRRSGRA